MDEPAAGLPEAEVPEFAAVVRAVRDEHQAGVLLIDHNMALIMDVCDRIHVLDQGTTLAHGTPDEIRTNLDVVAAYLGERPSTRTSSRDDLAARSRAGGGALRRGDGRPGAFDGRSKGEIVGLIGPNGAGKSTTLHAIMGLVPTRRVDPLRGASLAGKPPEAVARVGIALVPEGRRIFADLTVDENLRLGLAGRRTRAGADDDIEAVHGLFPIVREFRRRPAGVLSGGQQQQLAIARALVAKPRCPAARRAVARTRPEGGRHRLRCTRRDPTARDGSAPRRAARAANGRVCRPHLPDGERRD